MRFSPAVHEYLLAFADDEHFVGARHTSWIGLGPFLEEDLAFCSIAQDELGHAIGLYAVLLDDAADLDRHALLRPAGEYRSCWLAEIECSDWNDSLVRHWLYDRAEALRWEVLAQCPDPDVAALAARAQREESFHLAHAEQFMQRIASADDTGRILDSIARLVPLAAAVFDPVESEQAAIDEGFVNASSAELANRWQALVRDDLGRWGLAVGWPTDEELAAITAAQARRRGRSDGFPAFHDDLRRVLSIDTSATW